MIITLTRHYRYPLDNKLFARADIVDRYTYITYIYIGT